MTIASPRLSGGFSRFAEIYDWWLAGLRGKRRARKIPSLPLLPADAITSREAFEERVSARKLKTAQHKGVGLIVAHDAWLTLNVSLPNAAWNELREMAAFEIGERTPLNPEHVWFDLERHDGDRFTIHLVPRASAEHAIEVLESCGISTRFLMSEEKQLIDLGAKHGGGEKRGSRLILLALAATACGAGVLVYDQHRRIASAERALAQVMPEARKTRALQVELRALRDLVNAEPSQPESRVSTVEVIEELSRRIPDTGWLSEIVIDQGAVRIKAKGLAVEALVRELAASELFVDTRLSGTVTTEDSGLSQFEIIAEFAP